MDYYNERSKYLSIFINIANKWLLEANEAENERNYLFDRVDKDKIKQFKFGYFPKYENSITNFVDEFCYQIKKEPLPILEEFHLLYYTEVYNKIVWFFKNHHLLIPYFDMYGNCISISGRTLLSKEKQKEYKVSKYKNLNFERRYHLYGLNWAFMDIIEKNQVIIVEGQFDLIAGRLNGLSNIVALCGSKLSFEHVVLLKRFTNNFALILDHDEAGDEGFEKLNKNYSKYQINLTKLGFDKDSHDLFDFLQNHSVSEIKNINH